MEHIAAFATSKCNDNLVKEEFRPPVSSQSGENSPQQSYGIAMLRSRSLFLPVLWLEHDPENCFPSRQTRTRLRADHAQSKS
jgi:hypothetical protein